MLKRARRLRPSSRPRLLMMPSWYATPFVESLLFVASVLEHHGLRYIAHRGTLLGALRLGGLLPWDDDADLFLLDADAADVEARLGPVFAAHGFILRFRRPGYYFTAFPRLVVPLHMGGLTELGLMTRTGEGDDVVYDRHEPRRHLKDAELFPLRRVPFHGSYLSAPNRADVAMERMYGELAAQRVMARFRAPVVHPEVEAFWSEARPVAGDADWDRISARMTERGHALSFHIAQGPCSAWYLANRCYWMAMDGVRAAAGGADAVTP
jgi:LicD family